MEYHRRYLTKLKIILQSNVFYLISIIIIVIYVLVFTRLIKYESKYQDETHFIGTVSRYVQKEDSTTIYLDSDEQILVNYYDKIAVEIGDKLEVSGTISKVLPNTIPNTFNYAKYLYNNHIYTKVVANNIKVVSKSSNIFIKIKNWILNRVKGNTYLRLFICGDKTGMDSDVYNNFKDCGIAHLLAISGMHVSVFILILNKLLFFLHKNIKDIVIIGFLLFYCYLVNFTPSILRVVISFILGVLLAKTGIHISSCKKLLLTAFIIILLDPFNIYSTSFQYSFSAALGVITTESKQRKNYFLNIIIISFYTLLFTLPITINLNYECNLILFISNLLFIPYVSFFLYPLGLITFIFPFLNSLFAFFTNFMEKIIGILNKFPFLVINIPKMPFILIIIFYILLFGYLYYSKRKLLFVLIGLLLMVKVNAKLDFNDYVIFFDVGQGDCAAIISKFHNDVIMIDTGGLQNYQVSNNVILYFKSIGITKIDTLLLSHGDFDHMGDASNIIDNLKVKEVIFNQGEFNDLEKSLIKKLTEKHIKYSQDAGHLAINDNQVFSLNNGVYSDENNSSNVILFTIAGKKFMFMGDAGVQSEENILNDYELTKIDVLKVGHHGSNTSSSEKFIAQINPEYAIISVGRNNRYHHPNASVLTTLNKQKIYRTDYDGSIIFKMKENDLDIITYAP